MFANITHDDRFAISMQSSSPGVPDATNMLRPSSSRKTASFTVRPFSIINPSAVENVEITATSSIFFSTESWITATSDPRPKQSLQEMMFKKNPETVSKPSASQSREFSN
jgi:hypothetical protein